MSRVRSAASWATAYLVSGGGPGRLAQRQAVSTAAAAAAAGRAGTGLILTGRPHAASSSASASTSTTGAASVTLKTPPAGAAPVAACRQAAARLATEVRLVR